MLYYIHTTIHYCVYVVVPEKANVSVLVEQYVQMYGT